MTQQAINELRRRAGLDGWTYWFVLICLATITAFIAWATFRHGIFHIDGWDVVSLIVCLVALSLFWHNRPLKKLPPTKPLGLL